MPYDVRCSLSFCLSRSLCTKLFNWSESSVRADRSIFKSGQFPMLLIFRFDVFPGFALFSRRPCQLYNNLTSAISENPMPKQETIRPSPNQAHAFYSKISSLFFHRRFLISSAYQMPRISTQAATSHHAHATNSKAEDKELPRPIRIPFSGRMTANKNFVSGDGFDCTRSTSTPQSLTDLVRLRESL